MLVLIPFFCLMLVADFVLAKLKGVKNHVTFRESIRSSAIGLSQEALNSVFLAGTLAIVSATYSAYHLLDLSATNPLHWLLVFLLNDMTYYLQHRAFHRVNLFWAAHSIHHQTNEYTYASAFRQSWTTRFMSTPFFIPLALIGVPADMFMGTQAVLFLIQFFAHSSMTGRLGFLEKFLVTPAHHRIHHATNPQYLDKNYAGGLIFWDKLFGSLVRESEPVVLGLVGGHTGSNPITANFAPFAKLWHYSKQATSLKQKWTVWFGTPEQLSAFTPPPAHPEAGKPEVPLTMGEVLASSSTLLAGIVTLWFYLDRSPNLPLGQKAMGILVVVGLVTLSTLLLKSHDSPEKTPETLIPLFKFDGNEVRQFFKTAVQVSTWPLMILGLPILAYLALKGGIPGPVVILSTVVFSCIATFLLERAVPLRKEWVPTLEQIRGDFTHLVFNEVGVQMILRGIPALVGLFLADRALSSQGLGVWQSFGLSHLPSAVQAALVLVAMEFFFYWQHRIFHEIPALWNLHKVHHAPTEMNLFAGLRNHPLGPSLLNVSSLFISTWGMAPEIYFTACSFVVIRGFLQHANVDLKTAWLDRVFVTETVHHWHHSIIPDQGNTNFGVVLSIWDHVPWHKIPVFGRLLRFQRTTFYLPGKEKADLIVGVDGYEDPYFLTQPVRSWIRSTLEPLQPTMHWFLGKRKLGYGLAASLLLMGSLAWGQDLSTQPEQAEVILVEPKPSKGAPALLGHIFVRRISSRGPEFDTTYSYGGDLGTDKSGKPLSSSDASILRGLGWVDPFKLVLEIEPLKKLSDHYLVNQERWIKRYRLPNDPAALNRLWKRLKEQQELSDRREMGPYRFLTRNCTSEVLALVAHAYQKPLDLLHYHVPPVGVAWSLQDLGIDLQRMGTYRPEHMAVGGMAAVWSNGDSPVLAQNDFFLKSSGSVTQLAD